VSPNSPSSFGQFTPCFHPIAGLDTLRAQAFPRPGKLFRHLSKEAFSMRLRSCILAIAAACVLGASAQTPKHGPNLEPKTPRDMRLPTITYELVFPGDTEARHVLTVDSSGNAAYRTRATSAEHPEPIAAGEARILKFTVSQRACTRIFELAREVNNFAGSSSNPPLDPTFSKSSTRFVTLSYSYGPLKSFHADAKSVRSSITFTRPPNTVIQRLTSILEKMAESLERGQIAEAGRIAE
jgi:hypothetical protein